MKVDWQVKGATKEVAILIKGDNDIEFGIGIALLAGLNAQFKGITEQAAQSKVAEVKA